MLWVSDASAALIYLASEWVNLSGQSAEAGIGEGWVARVHAEDQGLALGTLRRATALHERFSVRYRLARPEGGYRWVVAGGTPSLAPIPLKFLGYLGSVDEIVGADSMVAAAEIGRFGPNLKPLGLYGPADIDYLAEQIIYARALAEKTRENGILNVLDLALMEVGFRLAQEMAPSETLPLAVN